MSLDAKIHEHLDRQEEAGWHLDWPEALAALRTVLDLHSPGEGELREGYCVDRYHPEHCDCEDKVIYRCPVCVKSWADEQTQDAPCSTVREIVAHELGITPDTERTEK